MSLQQVFGAGDWQHGPCHPGAAAQSCVRPRAMPAGRPARPDRRRTRTTKSARWLNKKVPCNRRALAYTIQGPAGYSGRSHNNLPHAESLPPSPWGQGNLPGYPPTRAGHPGSCRVRVRQGSAASRPTKKPRIPHKRMTRLTGIAISRGVSLQVLSRLLHQGNMASSFSVRATARAAMPFYKAPFCFLRPCDRLPP